MRVFYILSNIVKLPLLGAHIYIQKCIWLCIYKVPKSIYHFTLGIACSAWHIVGTQLQCVGYFWGSTQPFSLRGIFLIVSVQVLLFLVQFKRKELTQPSLCSLMASSLDDVLTSLFRTPVLSLKRLFLLPIKWKSLPVKLPAQEFSFLDIMVEI